jgi:hypothetical protein
MPGILSDFNQVWNFLRVFFLESHHYQISPNLSSRSRADTCGQTDGHDGYYEVSRRFFATVCKPVLATSKRQQCVLIRYTIQYSERDLKLYFPHWTARFSGTRRASCLLAVVWTCHSMECSLINLKHELSLLHSVRIGCRAHPASYSLGAGREGGVFLRQ